MMRSALLVGTLSLAAACGPGLAPTLQPVDAQTGYVGSFLTVDLEAVSRGGTLSYGYDALKEDQSFDFSQRPEPERPEIANTKADGTSAVFRWRPASWAVGTWIFTFRVTEDGGAASEQTVKITVKPTQEQGIRFIEPQNEGISVNLAVQPCIVLQLLVTSPEIPTGIALGVVPALANAVLEMKAPSGQGTFEAMYRFCPTAAQAQNTYAVTFLATTTNEAKDYEKAGVIVARKPYWLGLRGAAQ